MLSKKMLVPHEHAHVSMRSGARRVVCVGQRQREVVVGARAQQLVQRAVQRSERGPRAWARPPARQHHLVAGVDQIDHVIMAVVAHGYKLIVVNETVVSSTPTWWKKYVIFSFLRLVL